MAIGVLFSFTPEMRADNLSVGFGILFGAMWMLGLTMLMLDYSVLGCAVLLAGYRQADLEEKRQIRWPLSKKWSEIFRSHRKLSLLFTRLVYDG